MQRTDQEGGDILKTPEKMQITISQVPTPGIMATKLQVEILKKTRFDSVIGSSIVDSWGLNWDVLENPDISFADSYRISGMSKLNDKLIKLSRNRIDEPFADLFAKFCALRTVVTDVHAVRLETVANKYFDSIFPGSTFQLVPKSGGIQLGIKVIATLPTGEEKLYYIKTHSDGRLTSKSTAAKLVNPQELFVYKVLEYTGLGCETHFLQRSAEDVYIATLDAGYDGSFETFAKAAGRLVNEDGEAYGQSLWGALQDICADPVRNDWETVGIIIRNDAIAQNFLLQISSLDMLSHILGLHDLLSNTENFGFFIKVDERPALKVIDFRVAHQRDFIVDREIFRGFLARNGWYNKAGMHRAMRYGLVDGPKADRVANALYVLTQGSLMQFRQHVQLAYRDVITYIKNTDVFAVHIEELIENIDSFNVAILNNFEFFKENLKSWVMNE